jgi:hypothetical protein
MSCNLFSSGEICGTWRSFFTGGAVAGGLEACASEFQVSDGPNVNGLTERNPKHLLCYQVKRACKDILTPFLELLEKSDFMIRTLH